MAVLTVTDVYVEVPQSTNTYTLVQNKGGMPIGFKVALSLPADITEPDVIIQAGECVRYEHDGNKLYVIAVSSNSAISYTEI